jgi:hypothetical protein
LAVGVDDGRLLVLLPGAASDDGGAAVRWFIRVAGVGLDWSLLLLDVDGRCLIVTMDCKAAVASVSLD